jgi:hypothetical protein
MPTKFMISATNAIGLIAPIVLFTINKIRNIKSKNEK